MCYGQTGAGKTFTMTGGRAATYKSRGIVPRSVSHVFRSIADKPDTSYVVRISYLEIYNDVMYDLLAPSGTGTALSGDFEEDKASGHTRVKGLSRHVAATEQAALNLLFEGETNRAIGQHALNKASSRSHCIFTIHVEARSRVESDERLVESKLNLVDLAGSERVSKTGSSGVILKEAMYINKSLTFLEQVIIALSEKRRDHIPYRRSKLTNVLKDSLGGNCKTLMFANIWPESSHLEETISTLKFATRMMRVANLPVINIQHDPVALVRKYEREVRELKAELAMHDQLAGRTHISYEPYTEEERAGLKGIVRQYLDGTREEVDVVNLRQIRELFSIFKELVKATEVETAARVRATLSSAETSATGGLETGSGVPSTPTGAGSGSGAGKETPTGGRAGSGSGNRGIASRIKRGKKALFGGDKKDDEKKGGSDANKTSGSSGGDEGVTEDNVGEVDGSGFGVAAPAGVKAAAFPVGSPVNPAKVPAMAMTPTAAKSDPDDPALAGAAQTFRSDASSATARLVNSQPPLEDRAAAFEQFKAGPGFELANALKTGKVAVRDGKASVRGLSEQVNGFKSRIDEVKSILERKASEKAQHPELSNTTTEVIDEEEYVALGELKEAKRGYRAAFDSLKTAREELAWAERAVVNTRAQLVADFEEWYGAGVGGEGEGDDGVKGSLMNATSASALAAARGDVLDNGEAFEKMNMDRLMQEDPEAVSFYAARKAAASGVSKRGGASKGVRGHPGSSVSRVA